MRKHARLLLVGSLAPFLMIGCASTTPLCEPLVLPYRPPAALLIRPQEPLLLGSSPPGETSGTSSSSTQKTPGAGSPAGPN